MLVQSAWTGPPAPAHTIALVRLEFFIEVLCKTLSSLILLNLKPPRVRFEGIFATLMSLAILTPFHKFAPPPLLYVWHTLYVWQQVL